MATMTNVLIDGKSIHSELDLHTTLEKQLEFGEYYGRNLAALRDRLTTDIERPVNLTWRDSEFSRSELGEELFSRITAIFQSIAAQDVEYGWDERFEFHLE